MTETRYQLWGYYEMSGTWVTYGIFKTRQEVDDKAGQLVRGMRTSCVPVLWVCTLVSRCERW